MATYWSTSKFAGFFIRRIVSNSLGWVWRHFSRLTNVTSEHSSYRFQFAVNSYSFLCHSERIIFSTRRIEKKKCFHLNTQKPLTNTLETYNNHADKIDLFYWKGYCLPEAYFRLNPYQAMQPLLFEITRKTNWKMNPETIWFINYKSLTCLTL